MFFFNLLFIYVYVLFVEVIFSNAVGFHKYFDNFHIKVFLYKTGYHRLLNQLFILVFIKKISLYRQ